MNTPDKRMEEIQQKYYKEGYKQGKFDAEMNATQYHQDLMSEVVERIEKAKYPKDSTQGCNCNGYNNALTEAQTIIKNLTRE